VLGIWSYRPPVTLHPPIFIYDPVLALTLEVAQLSNSVEHDWTITTVYTSQERPPFNSFCERSIPMSDL